MEPKGERISHPIGDCFNTELPPPLDSEYKEVAWAVPAYQKDIVPIWISRPKI